MPTTAENLKTAFAGESQANRKYLAYASKADKEGYPQIAKLFRAAAAAETIHALAHLQNQGGSNSFQSGHAGTVESPACAATLSGPASALLDGVVEDGDVG
jgi:rubrerythrin